MVDSFVAEFGSAGDCVDDSVGLYSASAVDSELAGSE